MKSLHQTVQSSLKIAVFGSDGDHCSESAKKLAYETGKEIAQKGHIVLTGGGAGVMQAANKGAFDVGGLSIGILPGSKRKDANPYCSLVIPSEIGYARAQLLANSIDAAIVIEGSVGTYIEVAIANYLEKPVVVLRGSGGVAQELSGKIIDRRRKKPSVYSAKNPKDAVTIIESTLKTIISNVDEMIQLSQAHAAPYTSKVFDTLVWADSNVCSTLYSYACRFFIENWDLSKGQTVLDMGTGSGVLALFAAFAGAKEVVAVDINPHACNITQKNITFHYVERVVQVIQSDLFTKLKEKKFDRILFNLPYWNQKAQTELEKAFFDENYQVFCKFLQEAKSYLQENGKIILLFSEQGDHHFVEQQIALNGYKIVNKIREEKGHTRLLYFLEYPHSK